MSVTNPNTKADDKPSRYQVDDLLVDVGRRCVNRDGVELEITGRSFELLLALIRAAPNAVSLDQLMSEVWRGMVVNNDTVTQRVKVLRQALGDDPEQPRYIASVRGHGYRLLAQVTRLGTIEKPASESDRHAPQESASETIQSQNAQPATRSSAYRFIVIPVIVIIGLLVLGAWWFTRTNTQAPTVARDSVAVLPFANMTGDTNKEYLADGVAEELINTLTKVSGLKVPARTSTFAYKGRDTDIRQIAKDLGVGTILQGSVRAAGTRLRITAQLINAQDGLHLWSATYDEEFTDIFKLQDKLATQIAQALQPNLSGAVAVSISHAQPTQDVEAYNSYLQGVSLVQRKENAARAIEYFQKAIDRDPKFARAYAMIAEAHMGVFAVDPARSTEHLLAAERAARQALALDANVANAHTALAGVIGYRRQSLEAVVHLRAALAAAPDDGFIHAVASLGYAYLGQMRKALEEAQNAYRLAPADAFVNNTLADILSLAGDSEAALKHAAAARDLGVVITEYYPEVLSKLRARRYSEAVDAIDHVTNKNDPEQVRAAQIYRRVFTALADPSQREAVVAAARTTFLPAGTRVRNLYLCIDSGTAYAMLGALDTAYDAVNRCFDQAAPDELYSVGFLGGVSGWWTPELRAFRANPRFQALVTRLNLMEYYRQYGPPDDCDLKDGKLTCH